MITGKILRDAMISGANNISNQRTRVDELNVFPVPDGDTGTNMSMTIGAARPELENLPDDCTVAQASKCAASAMLRGARGNSGVITSLLFRGFSKALKDKTNAEAADLASALQMGVDAAYKAVMKPTEGTILTVTRLAAEAAAASTQTEVPALWDEVLAAGQKALDDTPNLLPVLKKAGVVDAGGQGIMLVFEGMKQVFDGGEVIQSMEVAAKPKVASTAAGKGVFADDLMKVEDIKNGYCTQFLLHKDEGASVTRLRAFLESNGDSVVVIEDDDVANCHVHTSDPGMMLSEAIKYGYLTDFKIENMHEQFLARQKQGKSLEKQAAAEERAAAGSADEFVYAAVDPEQDYGFVAVAAGEGLKSVFTDLGVEAVVSGGQTMNPATEDILAAIQSVPAKTVFVLPNNKNIIMAAEQAQKLADRKVIVLPTRTVPQGMTAMLNFDPGTSADENAINMMAAADKVATGLITYAARDSEFDGKTIKKGEIMALENGKIVATGNDITKMTYRLARSMKKKDTQFITVISGCEISDADAEKTTDLVRSKCGGNIEVSHISGGQPVYYYMISVE
ncbi:DAK2 domain-containing protein [Subdoligranulum sp. DSM 109015]|uniref:DAK2 domain-containing protein n=1 Tax=Gemmiger gallinarum TaxID=2779354 RepID=A0ABR9QZE6_9FIRM|nr:DAK2 domain-containing protein [Gemmiger gallinarum]MBE5036221.1 DAK2 domain-containing protein [Gemmiger gallinarum]